MEATDLFKSIAVDTWYKALMYLGGAALFGSFFWEVRGITNGQLQLLTGGAFLIGVGEWKNHKVASWFKPPHISTGPAAFMSAPLRSADAVGVLLDVIGVLLFAMGILSIAGGAAAVCERVRAATNIGISCALFAAPTTP